MVSTAKASAIWERQNGRKPNKQELAAYLDVLQKKKDARLAEERASKAAAEEEAEVAEEQRKREERASARSRIPGAGVTAGAFASVQKSMEIFESFEMSPMDEAIAQVRERFPEKSEGEIRAAILVSVKKKTNKKRDRKTEHVIQRVKPTADLPLSDESIARHQDTMAARQVLLNPVHKAQMEQAERTKQSAPGEDTTRLNRLMREALDLTDEKTNELIDQLRNTKRGLRHAHVMTMLGETKEAREIARVLGAKPSKWSRLAAKRGTDGFSKALREAKAGTASGASRAIAMGLPRRFSSPVASTASKGSTEVEDADNLAGEGGSSSPGASAVDQAVAAWLSSRATAESPAHSPASPTIQSTSLLRQRLSAVSSSNVLGRGGASAGILDTQALAAQTRNEELAAQLAAARERLRATELSARNAHAALYSHMQRSGSGSLPNGDQTPSTTISTPSPTATRKSESPTLGSAPVASALWWLSKATPEHDSTPPSPKGTVPVPNTSAESSQSSTSSKVDEWALPSPSLVLDSCVGRGNQTGISKPSTISLGWQIKLMNMFGALCGSRGSVLRASGGQPKPRLDRS